MSKVETKLLPRNNGNLRSCTFEVGCGEYGLITGYGLCPGMCVKFNVVHEDRCRCIHNEKPYCVAGGQIGIDACSSNAAIPMPGTYVAYLCLEEGVEIPDDFCVYANVCTNVENLQAVTTATVGA